jgi:hypothetical protein
MIGALVLLMASASPVLKAAAPPAMCPVKNSIGHCVYFRFEYPAMSTPKYTVNVREDGLVHYWVGDLPEDKEESTLPWLSASPATVKKIFDAVPFISKDGCQTHLKNIADTGKKTLQSFTGDEYSECVFNYSDEERVNAAAAVFQAIAETMQAGERLKHKHRFDHLGLDAELDSLLAEAKDGRAIELQNIAPVLQSIVDDDEMMSPARRKAKSLLEIAGIHAAPGV